MGCLAVLGGERGSHVDKIKALHFLIDDWGDAFRLPSRPFGQFLGQLQAIRNSNSQPTRQLRRFADGDKFSGYKDGS